MMSRRRRLLVVAVEIALTADDKATRQQEMKADKLMGEEHLGTSSRAAIVVT